MQQTYTPVPYVFREIIQEELEKRKTGKVFYFSPEDKVESAEGSIIQFEEISGQGLFITIGPDLKIRIDRIITLFGKPGAAFDEYDAYGSSCMECHGGYDLP